MSTGSTNKQSALRAAHDRSDSQQVRNEQLLAKTPTLRDRVESDVLPLILEPGQPLSDSDTLSLAALEKRAARIAIRAVASLARVNDIDHLGGGLDLIPPLLMTLACVDYDRRHYTIEHGHTSIGYYSALAAFGFLDVENVVSGFRRSLDIAGHVSWVPGGTQLSSGRLGVMMPVGTGFALGLRANKGDDALVVCHCGDAGWISGQALNGFAAASLHRAPIIFVMHRNGIQLSGTTARIMSKDPRPTIASLGIEILEIRSLHDRSQLFEAYGQAFQLAREGRPSLVYPTGYSSSQHSKVTLADFGRMYDVVGEVASFAAKQGVPLGTEIWIPGALMSFRDIHAMLECLFYVNNLPGGEGHHDGGMKGRDEADVLSGAMLRLSEQEDRALAALQAKPPRRVSTVARPPKGTPNLVLPPHEIKAARLPLPGAFVTARVGAEEAYVLIASRFPKQCFVVSCDLDPSTRLGKAAALLPSGHRFEMSIQEQAAALMTGGLGFCAPEPQLNVFSTFTAFIEGIAREGFELWRYQRNLNGRNEGLNVLMHLSHVGTCTGRDHYSGWSLDWVNLALGYLPYLRRFYAPADARSAFLAVIDAAGERGGHIVAIPRDGLPILTKQGSDEALWAPEDAWEPVTLFRQHAGASVAVLALGAPAFVAGEACDIALELGVASDVYVINGFPLAQSFLSEISARYRSIVTIEDGLIGSTEGGLRGFAGYVASLLSGSPTRLQHFGISDPQVAPSEYYTGVWDHFGMTKDEVAAQIVALGRG